MLLWNLYFLIKFGLHFAGVLTLSPLWNLALFILLIATNPAAYQNKRLMTVLRYLLFTGPAIALLLHELGLVVSLALIDQIKALFGFSTDYLLELIKRTIEPWMLWGALGAYMLIRVLDRYFRISSWVGFGLLAVLALQTWPLLQEQTQVQNAAVNSEPQIQARENLSPAELLALGQLDFQKLRVARDQESQTSLRDNSYDGAGPGAVLQGFFERQRARAIEPFAPTTPPDFDVMVLHPVSTIEFIKVFPRVFAGTHTSHPAVEIVRSRTVKIEAKAIAYADGERIGQLPITAECIQGALKTWVA
mgnify:CR=1 FL=1